MFKYMYDKAKAPCPDTLFSALCVAMVYPNFTAENGSRQPMFLAITGILVLLSTIVVALR